MSCTANKTELDKASSDVRSVPFTELPGQTKLFLDHLNDPGSLRKFYPSGFSIENVGERVLDVLANYVTDRNRLCDVLQRQNKEFGPSASTFGHIDSLRQPDTVAVVTGQQVGLFGGPLYSIYKAISAIKLAECLRSRGQKAVPVFWMATEDHDLEEVNEAFILGKDNGLHEFQLDQQDANGHPVGKIALGNSVNVVVGKMFETLSGEDLSSAVREMAASSWTVSDTFGSGFGKFFAKLFAEKGLIMLDPLDTEIKRLAAPLIKQAILHSNEIVAAIRRRDVELEKAGYHSQVVVEDDYFPVFWHSDEGSRRPLRKSGEDLWRDKVSKREFTTDELAETAISEPERFSPGVMLRPVVQDYLLPTLCYFGGAAEIAYFAQNSEVYRLLDRPATPIFHRQSFTIVESKQKRTMEKFAIELTDVLSGIESVRSRIVEEQMDPATARLFAESEEKINTELNRLDQALSGFDVTLAENLATRRRKIIYHIGALRKKFQRRRIEKDEEARRRLDSLFAAIAPRGHLQERTLGIVTFLDRYGPDFVEQVYKSADLDDKGHRVIYL